MLGPGEKRAVDTMDRKAVHRNQFDLYKKRWFVLGTPVLIDICCISRCRIACLVGWSIDFV